MRYPKDLPERELRALEVLADQLMRTGTMVINEGTYECPYCGMDTTHTHTEIEIRHAKLYSKLGKLVKCPACGQFDPPNTHPCPELFRDSSDSSKGAK